MADAIENVVSLLVHKDREINAMPHITVEYSANVADAVDIDQLLAVVHDAAYATGLAPLAGLRTRGERRDNYVVADGHPDNSFLAIWARLGPRDPEEKTAFIEGVLGPTMEFLGERAARMAVSIEMHDINAEFRVNVNNLHDYIG